MAAKSQYLWRVLWRVTELLRGSGGEGCVMASAVTGQWIQNCFCANWSLPTGGGRRLPPSATVRRASRLLYLQTVIIFRPLAFRTSLSFSFAMVPVSVT